MHRCACRPTDQKQPPVRSSWSRRNVRPPTSANSPAHGSVEAQHVAPIAFCRCVGGVSGHVATRHALAAACHRTSANHVPAPHPRHHWHQRQHPACPDLHRRLDHEVLEKGGQHSTSRPTDRCAHSPTSTAATTPGLPSAFRSDSVLCRPFHAGQGLVSRETFGVQPESGASITCGSNSSAWRRAAQTTEP